MVPNTGAAWLRSVLRVIKTFAEDSPWRTAAQVASRSGLSEPDAHGLLLVLCGAGLVRMEGHRFLLTPAVLEGAFAFTSSRPQGGQPSYGRFEQTSRPSGSCVLARR